MLPSFLLPPLVLLLFFLCMYIIALIRTDNSVADVAWGLGFILIGTVAMVVHQAYTPRAFLIMTLVLIWGSRLAIHIFRRNRGKGEDYRYKAWRDAWGQHAWIKSFLQVFLLQACFLLVVSLPIQLTMLFSQDSSLGWVDVFGFLGWCIGFFFESVGDAQLAAFKKNPENKGKILQTGLWKYTRHPNYFGESLMWWSIALIASQVPYGFIGFLGAAVITATIRFVSGVPLLEKKYEGRADWEEYKKKTPVFIPLPAHF